MFRQLLKFPVKINVRNNLFQTPSRMKAAARVNAKPYMEIAVLHGMKPPVDMTNSLNDLKS
jgi:hypothetical protein